MSKYTDYTQVDPILTDVIGISRSPFTTNTFFSTTMGQIKTLIADVQPANQIVFGTGTGLNSSSNLTWNGTSLSVNGSVSILPMTVAGILHNNTSGLLSSSLIVNADIDAAAAIDDTKLATIATAGKVSNSATTATSLNTANSIVLRDGLGGFSAGTITASLNGNATTATTAISFSGSLSGDVTGTQSATVIANSAVTNAKLSNMANNTFKGNISGSSAAPSDITVVQMQTALGLGTMAFENSNAVSISGGSIAGVTLSASSITVPSFSTAGVVHNNSSGAFFSSLIVNADITTATIANSKLATMANNTFKGNVSGSTASPSDLTVAQMQSALGITGSLTIANTQVGFGNSSNNLIGSANFTWNDSTKLLQLASGTEINLGSSITARKLVIYSTTTNNFQFYGLGVSAGQFEYVADSSATDHVFYAGTSTSTRQELFRVKGNKNITTQAGGGIQFGNSTSGYAAATLDYNEGPFTVNMVLSGPWGATTVNFPVTLIRTGNIVTMQWNGMAAGVARTTSAIIASQSGSNNIPARFGTSALNGFTKAIRILDGSANTSLDVGAINLVNGAGGLFLNITNAAGTPFSNAYCGIPFGEISWQYA